MIRLEQQHLGEDNGPHLRTVGTTESSMLLLWSFDRTARTQGWHSNTTERSHERPLRTKDVRWHDAPGKYDCGVLPMQQSAR